MQAVSQRFDYAEQGIVTRLAAPNSFTTVIDHDLDAVCASVHDVKYASLG